MQNEEKETNKTAQRHSMETDSQKQSDDKFRSKVVNPRILVPTRLTSCDSTPDGAHGSPSEFTNSISDRAIMSTFDTDGKKSRDESSNFANNNCCKDNEIEIVNSAASCSGYGELEQKNCPQTTVNCSFSLRSVGSICCRICHGAENVESLISPCLCSGTVAYVHIGCLEHWLNTSGTIHCELCQFRFPIKMSLRYGVFQSLRLWFRHPNNRGLLQADVVVCSLLSVVTFGIIAISFLGLHMLQENRYGLSRLWTQGSLVMFLVIVVFAYCVNLFLIAKAEIVPWFRWWQSARQVKLIFFDRRVEGRPLHAGWGRKHMETPIDVEREIQTTNISSTRGITDVYNDGQGNSPQSYSNQSQN